MTQLSESHSLGRDRWMIQAVLCGGLEQSALSRLIDIIGHRARVFLVDGLLVVASRVETETRNEVSLQHQIKDSSMLVNDLHRMADILPFRFGVLVTSDELVSAVRKNKDWYRAMLNSVKGYTELNLRWAVAEEPGDVRFNPVITRMQSGSKGIEYMRSKLLSKQTSSQVEGELRDIANDLATRFRDQEIKWQSSVGKLNVKSSGMNEDCYVIARVELLVRRESALVVLNEGLSLLLRSKKPTVASGPWPPYSFIESGNVECLSHQMQRCAITFPDEAVS